MKNILFISLLFSFLFLGLNNTLFAQDGYSSASVSMNRANTVFSADQVVIEEYINYHRHNIDLPKDKENIALSLDYQSISDKNIVLQIGIATKSLMDYSQMQPININLVIDVSGSMQSDNRLGKVKKALAKFTKGLRSEDYISIVAYDSEAKVILQSQKVGDVYNLDRIIESLSTGGSTNLYDGMVLGYEQAKQHFNPDHTNKVILLTDGIANVGITDVEKIVAKSYLYNKEGIDISTVGVGSDLNYSLLQQIAKEGKGANHFVGNVEEDIIKVFEDELESLLSPIAKNVYLEIDLPNNLRLIKLFGYTPQYNKNSIKIPLKNINSGLTQVILCEVEVINGKKPVSFSANLNYFSYKENEDKTIKQEMKIETSKISKTEREGINKNTEVVKNFYIGKLAYSLKEMAEAVSNQKYHEGRAILETSIQDLETTFPYLKDKDMLRIKEIVLSNKTKLEAFIESQEKQ